MNSAVEPSIHEVDFFGQIASAANILFAQEPAAFPYIQARVEGFGAGVARKQRRGVRFFEPDGRWRCAPGRSGLTGQKACSAYADAVRHDAAQLANGSAVGSFRIASLSVVGPRDCATGRDRPLHGARVRGRLGLARTGPEDVGPGKILMTRVA